MKKKKKKQLKITKEVKKEASEFKQFIMRGNVLDLAVGVIVGGAFGKIVTSLVNDILMPLIGMILGGLDFSGLNLTIGDAGIAYGLFLQNIIDFLIISLCIFFIVRFVNRIMKKKEEPKEEATPVKTAEAILLEEIRDLLKKEG